MYPPFVIDNISEEIRQLVLSFINRFDHGIFLDSNSQAKCPVPLTGIKYDFIAAAGMLNEVGVNSNDLFALQEFLDSNLEKKNWIFGYLTYDVKNQIEKIHSSKNKVVGFPEYNFFVPKYIFISQNGETQLISLTEDPEIVWTSFLNKMEPVEISKAPDVKITYVPKRENYLIAVKKLLERIKRGDIYEVNFCQQIIGTSIVFNPSATYLELVKSSPGPFSCYLKHSKQYLLCASPERFVCKSGSKLFSQPIKGTARRGSTEQSDQLSKNHLTTSEKEKAENVMIVDLVRNDLSKFAVKGTVHVDELFGVYTFPRVHQMISTVSCEVKKAVTFTQIMRSAFPMGSMTGAPKVSAMKIIEEVENFRRGLFSGTVGYIQPDGDFDFNVVIRSILYDSASHAIAIPAGGAITNNSIPEEEFDEMVLKMQPQLQALGLDPEKIFN